MERPAKRARLLDEGDSASSDEEGGVPLQINEDYAKRHKHNAERNERQRLEEKYKNQANESESNSDLETEDEGELATETLDNEIAETLNALRSKDPRIYDKSHYFYRPEDAEATTKPKDKSKPIHLRDYHRQNLLDGDGQSEEPPAPTYAQEQDELKAQLVGQMHNAEDDEHDEPDAGSEDDNFMIRKPVQKPDNINMSAQNLDLGEAEEDPENYLNKFMASRAWVPSESSKYQPFESDDEDDDHADDFEQAYNLRFEDPARANEKLLSHARDTAAKYSVRREEPKGRKKARQDEAAQKAARKAEREEEKAKLRRLKIDEAHEKWLRLQEAAGLKKQNLPDDKLLEFLEKGFEEGNWDQEMQRLLGETYYEEKELEDLAGMDGVGEGDEEPPKWDDDIDIDDIVPEFDEEEERRRQEITLSDDEGGQDHMDVDQAVSLGEQETSKSAKKRQSRIARQKISELVDDHLTNGELPMAKHSGFRYRDTSPTAFGLTPREILMAGDSQLNDYAGLKKLASYREQERKERDKRKLGKKARLRKWRKDTFGKDFEEDTGARIRSAGDDEFEQWFNRARGLDERPDVVPNIKKGKHASGEEDAEHRKKKKKKSRKSKKEVAT